ncbi:MAG: GGDEF domain-containing protein [Chloroflexota bacterium]
MPVEPVLLLLLIAILANVALMTALVVPEILGRGGSLRAGDDDSGADVAGFGAVVGGEPPGADDVGIPTAAHDRVVRIVSWSFIILASTIVAITGLWPAAQTAILVLLAGAGLFVLVVHDLLPPTALGRAKFVLEASFALTFVTVLVLLTGGAASPFFYAYPLIVAGAALIVRPVTTALLALVASGGYLAASVLAPAGFSPTPATIATVAINLTALVLLAYVAMAVGREQRRSRDAAIRLSTIDPLTGLFNRTFFFAAVEREIARSARSGRGFCLLMMDLDGLKTVNDRWGHFVGDQVLRGVGEVIRRGIRRIDTPARYGGDEFVVLLPETDPTGAFVLAEKIRQGVAALSFLGAGQQIRASLSIGVVTYPYDGTSADELMISADEAMYTSKRQGKNQVIDYATARSRGVAGRSM